jgi:hypothetical protein
MDLKVHLKNKKILFFSVQTFNLEVEIKNKLEEFGAIVTYYDERPANNNFVKGIIRLKRSLVQKRIDNYYKKILSETFKIDFDFLFINRGEVVPEFFLKTFKRDHSECKLIFYTWDSFANYSHPTTILKYFDRKFTFDSDDAIKYNINFRPLFFIDGYKNLKSATTFSYQYDLLFLGTAHSDRYAISSRIVDFCKKNDLTSFCYYYIHGRLVYFYNYLFVKSFKKFDFKKLSFKSLKSWQIFDLYKKSNIILDINHPGQKGLTMRTFEAIGSGRKLITTNSEIKKYCFYNSKNIYIIDRDNIELSIFFFKSIYEDIDDDVYTRMSINGWIKCIFFEEEPSYWIKGIK